MLQWMIEKLGRFPYPEYRQVIVPRVPSAMENITLVAWNAKKFFVDERWKPERHLLTDIVILHEMVKAHTCVRACVRARDCVFASNAESHAVKNRRIRISAIGLQSNSSAKRG